MLYLAELHSYCYEVIERIVGPGKAPDGFLRVQGTVVPNKGDFTWQPIAPSYLDLRNVVTTLLSSFMLEKALVSNVEHQLSNRRDSTLHDLLFQKLVSVHPTPCPQNIP